MVRTTTIQCEYCNKKILTRFQIGYYDIPFAFYCNCGVTIEGCLNFENGKFDLTNAKEIETDFDDIDYYINLSSEFYCRKMAPFKGIEDMLSNGMTPFMISINCFDGENSIISAGEKMSEFDNFKKDIWPRVKPLYELLFNGHYELIKEKIDKFPILLNVENELDAYMTLHQIVVVNLSNLFKEKVLESYISIAKDIFCSDKINEINEFIKFLKTRMNFNTLSKKIFQIYSEWIDNFYKYLPIVYMSFAEHGDYLDKKQYGISTISFDELKSFYEKSYELILEMLAFIVGLNNIFERCDFNSFYDGSNVKDFDSYMKLTKYNRINAVFDGDMFSKCLSLNRNARNSIAHFDYEYDKATQLITFYDRHKDKYSESKLYLRDLAELCFDNLRLIMYINELFYAIRKIDYINAGNTIHVK